MWWPDILPKDTLPKDTLPKDTLPKDILPNGHFADTLSNEHFDERTFRRKDILPKRQLAGNRVILGVVTRTARSTRCSFDKVPSAKCPFGKLSFGKVSFGKMSGYR